MTELLEKAIAKVKTLPDDEQDTIAAIIIGKLENKKKLKILNYQKISPNQFIGSLLNLAE